MASSNAKCSFFLLSLLLCLSFQAYARDSKFFSKVSKINTNEKHESISLSPAQAPMLAPTPSPEPEVVERGYGLYGQELSQNYEYPPTTTNPTKGGEEKFVNAEELSKNNNFNGFGNGNGRQGMSDTKFLENGKYYYDLNKDVKDGRSYFNKQGNGNGVERQGMSDTRFLENGKYYHDVNEEEKNNAHFNTNNYENENFEEFEEENNGHFNPNNYENENVNFEGVDDDEEEKNGHFNTNNFENENFENENFEDEKNGKYYYDHSNNGQKNSRFEIGNNGNEKFVAENHGMSDTRLLESGKYYYGNENENNNNNNNNNNKKYGVEDVGFHSNNNVEYANSYHGNTNENNEYERGYGNNHRNEYGYNGVKPKKFPNEYDTMEEYDREQGYLDAQDNKYQP